MSIIHEALKKAGRETDSPVLGAGSGSLLQETPKSDFSKSKSRVNWGPIFILLVLLLITGPILAPVLMNSFRTGMAPSFPASPLQAATAPAGHAAAQFAIEEAPLPAPAVMAPRPNLSISGIVFSPPDSYSLINGKIVKPGDAVAGAKVVKISQGSVMLSYQGETFTVPVNS